MTRAAAFLDRDGTLLVERGDWIRSPRDVRLARGAAAAVRLLNRARLAVVVITNQSGVARGEFSERDLAAVHECMLGRLRRGGGRVDALYYCPHHPVHGRAPYRRTCRCRKPRPGMIERAARELDLRLAGSMVVGDDLRDLELARGRPLLPVLVRSGKGRAVEAEAVRRFGAGLIVADDVLDGVRRALARLRRHGR